MYLMIRSYISPHHGDLAKLNFQRTSCEARKLITCSFLRVFRIQSVVVLSVAALSFIMICGLTNVEQCVMSC